MSGAVELHTAGLRHLFAQSLPGPLHARLGGTQPKALELGELGLRHALQVAQGDGFAILGAENAELIMAPGETRTLRWVPLKVGVYPFYCTDFCSALHQEMQGYVRVSARGSNVALSATTNNKAPQRAGGN